MSTPSRHTRILNCLSSKDTESDWTLEHAVEAGLTAATATSIPLRKDLRAEWWTVGDQEDTGSCVGWATADSVLRWHFVSAGRLAKTERLSPRFTWMAAKETDEFITRPTTFIETDGTSLKAALDVAKNFGAATDTLLPFASGKLFKGSAQAFYAKVAQLKISSYFNISLSTGHNLNDWKSWIANGGPILTRLDVDATWDDAKNTAGVLATYQPGTRRGGHAVALVGYDETHFIVRNSWGTELWGDAGFGYATHAYAEAAFSEAYGVRL